MKKLNLKAFTLVELIIVITILAVLATIAFVSFQGYTKDSRDSIRLTSLKNIEKWLQTFQITTWNYPDPDNKVNILASGSIIGYQWNVSDNLTKILKINKKPQDPLDGNLYTYSTNQQKTQYQLLTLKENNQISSSFNLAYAGNNLLRIPKTLGNNLWVILDTNNIPIEQTWTGVDIITTSNSYKIYLTDDIIISWTWAQLSDGKSIDEVNATIKYNNLLWNAKNIKILVIYPNTDTPHIKNLYLSWGYNVVIDSAATTLDKVKAYNPDIVVCDQFVWSCGFSFLNTLYNAGFNIVSQWNDTITAPFINSYISVTAATVLWKVQPQNNIHFLARWWESFWPSIPDTRQIITSLSPNAVKVWTDSISWWTELVYLEEVGKGKWFHIQTDKGIPVELFKRVNAWLLR